MTQSVPERRSRGPKRGRIFLAVVILSGLVWWAWPRVAPLFVGAFDFEDIETAPGFRRLAAGQVSGFPNPFIGLETLDPVDLSAEERSARSDMCRALFGGAVDASVVPIASFSDYNCPFCRVLTQELADIEARSEGSVQITWHEWPLLGPTSVFSARAAIAADMQGFYAAFHKRLMRGRFVPTESYLSIIAEDIGADPERLLADMNGSDVTARLRNTEALARIFGFFGTPALVVGRTVVIGSVSEATLTALIEEERRNGPAPACRT
ncbi:DsbA family protein [Marimonas sp. MJW-29]|uniref:DsbA family protein n=1 Tax=Sulfitobacter sediminis TaxID=3234186 RepID=A0ABV3RT45_9RHOB